MKDCVFCGIVEGKIPSHRIFENDEFVAFLGIFPKNPGMTVVASKKHIGSYLYQSLSDEALAKIHVFTKKVALAIDKSLGSMRCIQVMEGLEVDHAHLKLFPVYSGILDSMGEDKIKATDEELSRIAERIRGEGGLK